MKKVITLYTIIMFFTNYTFASCEKTDYFEELRFEDGVCIMDDLSCDKTNCISFDDVISSDSYDLYKCKNPKNVFYVASKNPSSETSYTYQFDKSKQMVAKITSWREGDRICCGDGSSTTIIIGAHEDCDGILTNNDSGDTALSPPPDPTCGCASSPLLPAFALFPLFLLPLRRRSPTTAP